MTSCAITLYPLYLYLALYRPYPWLIGRLLIVISVSFAIAILFLIFAQQGADGQCFVEILLTSSVIFREMVSYLPQTAGIQVSGGK